jgi:hypothetical protein
MGTAEVIPDTMYPPKSSLRSSVSRPSGNANVIPRCAYLLSPLRARLWNRNVGIEAPVKAAK